MQEELGKLQGDEEQDVNCGDAGLEAEFRRNVEMVRMHRRLAELKSKIRDGKGASDARQPTRTGDAPMQVEVADDMEEINFDGDDFEDMDLEELGIGDGCSSEDKRAKRAKLASWFGTQAKNGCKVVPLRNQATESVLIFARSTHYNASSATAQRPCLERNGGNQGCAVEEHGLARRVFRESRGFARREQRRRYAY